MPSSVPFLSIAMDLLLPPVSLAWLALVALCLPGRFRPRLLAALFLVPLVLLALPGVAGALIYSLRPPAASMAAGEDGPQAIVVLSAEAERTLSPEHLQVGPLTLEREKAGAALARATGLPVLVTGGIVNGPPPVGQLMVASMAGDFGVPVRWSEVRSGTTWENARFSAPILQPQGIRRVYVVTHAWHMRRALLAFRRAGFDPVAFPVRMDAPPRWEWGAVTPRISAWVRSFYAIHEWVGLLYYGWRR